MHTFEISGLGKAPFKTVNPKQHATETGCVFWCQHCGTMIKNRNFVKSSDNVVSVVGIDCLNKTGDLGLIDGQKRLAKIKRAEIRESEFASKMEKKHSIEREENGGLTNAETVQKLRNDLERIKGRFIDDIECHPVLQSLTQHGFEIEMKHKALLCQPYSAGQLAVLKKIHTKKISKSRVNSKAYKATSGQTFFEVDNLQLRLKAKLNQIDTMMNEIRIYHLK